MNISIGGHNPASKALLVVGMRQKHSGCAMCSQKEEGLQSKSLFGQRTDRSTKKGINLVVLVVASIKFVSGSGKFQSTAGAGQNNRKWL